MAVFKNDPFPGTNYADYLSWEKIAGPNGEMYYIVPGHPGYVYDPTASAATGRKVFRANPKEQMDELERQKRLEKQQEFNASPGGQLIPVVGSIGGLYLANEIMKPGGTTALEKSISKLLGIGKDTSDAANAAASGAAGNSAAAAGGSGTGGAGAGAGGASLTPPDVHASLAPMDYSPSGSVSVTGNVPAPGTSATPVSGEYLPGGGAYPVGPPAADGSVTMSDGSVYTNNLPPGTEVTPDGSILNSETGQMIGRVGQGVLGAYQMFQGFQQFGDDKIGGGLGVASGAANLGAALGYETAGQFAGPLTAIKGGYDVFNSWQHGGEGIRSAGAELGAGIGTIILPGVGTVIGAVAGNALGYGLDKLGIMHKTTTQHMEERWGEVANSKETSDYWKKQAEIAAQVRYSDYGGKMTGPDGTVEKWDFNKAMQWIEEGYQPTIASFRGVLGHQRTFGNDWGNYTPEQQDQIVKALAHEGLYKGDHGDILISDEDRARKVKDQILSGNYAMPQTDGFNTPSAPPTTPAQAAAQGAIARSNTRSPGIDMNGNRISY